MAHRVLAVVLTLVVLVWTAALLVACGDKPAGVKDPDAPVGKVTAVAGVVSVRRAAGAPQAVAVGLAVTRDMTFTTGPGASLEVRFDNNYTWKLAEERERAVASLRVVDLPAAASAQSIEDDLAGEEQDRTTGAGRHAEQSAAEGASTVEKPAVEATGGPRTPAAAPDRPIAPEVPILVEERAEDDEAAADEPPPRKRGGAVRAPAPAPAAAPPPMLEAAPAPPPPPPPAPKRAAKRESPGAGGSDGAGSGGSDDKRAAPGAVDAALANKVLAKRSAAVQACGKQHAATGRIEVRVGLDAAGKVTGVEVLGAYAGKPAGQCAADVVRATSFPALGGATTVTYSFVLAE